MTIAGDFSREKAVGVVERGGGREKGLLRNDAEQAVVEQAVVEMAAAAQEGSDIRHLIRTSVY